MPEKIELGLQDIVTEQALLGLVLMNQANAIDLMLDKLEEEDFSTNDTRLVFSTIKDMYVSGEKSFNEILVAKALQSNGLSKKIGGQAKLISFQSKVPYPIPNSEDIDTYISILKEKTMRRRMYDIGNKLRDSACLPEQDPSEGIGITEKALLDLNQGTASKRPDIKKVMEDAFDYAMSLYNRTPIEGSIKTGLEGLDNLLYEISPTDLVIIGARPAMGKSAIALNIMENVALKQGKGVAFYSLEMSHQQLGARMLFSQSGVSAEAIKRGELSDGDLQSMEEASAKISAAPIYIDDEAPMDVSHIVVSARMLKAEKNIGLIIIDYLQLMTGNRGKDGRQQEVSDISRSLKLLAKELGVPVIAISQLSRSLELRNDKRPQMSDIRESGAIEQDADIIMFLYRDEYYNPNTEDKGITEIIVAKHRNGKVGTAKMYFSGDTTHFYDLTPSSEESEAKQVELTPAADSKQEPVDNKEPTDGPPVIQAGECPY